MTRYVAVLGIFFVLVLAAAALIYYHGKIKNTVADFGEVAPFEFTERSGEPFGQKNLLGKLNVVDFIFTNCTGPCPRMSAVMAELYRYYETNERIQLVSISVDPDRDSLSVLRTYAERFGASDRRWAFLRGPIDEVQRLSEHSFRLGGELPALHSSKFILVDDRGRIRGYYDFDDSTHLSDLRQDLRRLQKAME